MGFKDDFEKYLQGELAEEENQAMEQEIEKVQTILEYVEDTLDDELFVKEDAPEKEKEDFGKAVAKAVSRKFRRYAVATGCVVIVIVLAVIFGLSPFLDKVCYDPTKTIEIETTNNGEEAAVVISEFHMLLSAYMEIFCGEEGFADPIVIPEGYGRYSIDARMQNNGKFTHHSLELVRNHLYKQDVSWNSSDLPMNAFTYLSGEEDSCALGKEEAKKVLNGLPEQVELKAAVSFDDLKNGTELLEFMGQNSARYLYCPLEVNVGVGSFMGFSPNTTGYVLTDGYDHETYPYLDLVQIKPEGEMKEEVLTQHVKSLFKYMIDNEEFLEIFDAADSGDTKWDVEWSVEKFETALSYVEENGIQTFGTVVCADKQELLDMLEDESVTEIYLMNVEFDLN